MKKVKLIFGVMMVLIFSSNILFPLFSLATEEMITITFNDVNLYNAIKEKLEDKINSYIDENYTIYVSNENIKEVKNLDISGKGITDISGLENFSSVTNLNLYDNNITDITKLSQMTNLKNLDLTNNRLTDIAALKSLTNLNALYLGTTGDNHGGGSDTSTNTINNISSLENLTNLEILELSGLNLEDISCLNKLTKLKRLYACFNKIKDISVIGNYSELQELTLDENNIENFKDVLSQLTNLTMLSLYNNNISDITFLSNLTNLKTLNLSNNKINDCSILEKLTDLENLSLGENSELVDISPLAQCSKLKNLYLPYNNIYSINSLNVLQNCDMLVIGNHIDDLEIFDTTSNRFDTDYMFKYNTRNHKGGIHYSTNMQNLSITTDKKSVQLPKIFLQAQNKNSKMYTDEEFELVNCTLSQNKDAVILNDNIKDATVTIQGGEIDGTKLEITYEGIDPPVLDVQYSTKEKTKGTVTVTINANEKIQQVEGWTINEEANALSKVYAKNTEETVRVYDIEGNEAQANILINNIDTTEPQVEINYSTTKLTNQNVQVTITANEEIKDVEGWTRVDKKTLMKTYETNVEKHDVDVYDLAGNKAATEIEITNIDKEPPHIDITYSSKNMTDKNIEVTIIANEKIQPVEGWTMDVTNTKIRKTYGNNTQEEITIYDLAGNKSVNKVEINNIIDSHNYEEEEIHQEEVPNEKIEVSDKEEDTTIAKTKIPQTGESIAVFLSGIILIIIVIANIMLKFIS